MGAALLLLQEIRLVRALAKRPLPRAGGHRLLGGQYAAQVSYLTIIFAVLLDKSGWRTERTELTIYV